MCVCVWGYIFIFALFNSRGVCVCVWCTSSSLHYLTVEGSVGWGGTSSSFHYFNGRGWGVGGWREGYICIFALFNSRGVGWGEGFTSLSVHYLTVEVCVCVGGGGGVTSSSLNIVTASAPLPISQTAAFHLQSRVFETAAAL